MERNPKLILSIGAILIALGGLAFYGLHQSKDFMQGPRIGIDEPKNGGVFTAPLIIISGTAKNVAFLTLNGRQIFTDERGYFTESLFLQEGYNIIAIDAKDRFGHAVEKRLELVYKPAKPATIIATSTQEQAY